MWTVFSFFADHISILHGLGALSAAGIIAAYLMIPGVAPIMTTIASAILGNRLGVGIVATAAGLSLGGIYATHKADLACDARVAALVAKSEADAKVRDDQIATDLEQKYTPIIAGLRKQSDDRQKEINRYAKTLPPSGCQLGIGPLRLRHAR